MISGAAIITKPQRTFVRFCARFDVREGESESQMMINGEAALQTVCVDVLKTTCSESTEGHFCGVRVHVGVRVWTNDNLFFGKAEG